MNTLTLREVLQGAESQSPLAWLYLPKDAPWTLETAAEILVSDEVGPDEEDDPDAGIPRIAKERNLGQILPVTTVQEIVANARQQLPRATAQDLYRAFVHYVDHDAFINFSK